MSGNHSHNHSHASNLHDGYSRIFVIGICLNLGFVVVEFAAGLLYNSIALLTDAGHNLSDVAGLLISLLAFRFAKRKATPTFTYGYKKATILAAFINAVILLIAIGVLGYESINRLSSPEAVQGNVIAWVATLGIVINSFSAYLFFKNKKRDLNVKSAYLHLFSDTLVSLGVVVAGIIIVYKKWYWLDPVIGLIIMIVILMSTWTLLRDSFKMVVDAVPTGIDIADIKETILKMKNVAAMDHIHVWPLSTSENALTAHVLLNNELNFEEKLKLVQEIKHQLEHLNIHHSTIEMDGIAKEIQC